MRPIVVHRHAPLLVVVGDVERIRRPARDTAPAQAYSTTWSFATRTPPGEVILAK